METGSGIGGWDALWEKVRLTFTDDDSDSYARRCALRDKNMRKHGISSPPVDEGALKAVVVEYAKTLRWAKARDAHGVTEADFVVADQYCPEVVMAREFVRKVRNAARDEELAERESRWIDALDEKATDRDGVSKADSRAAMFLLERTSRKAFGRDEAPSSSSDAARKSFGGGIQINLIGDAAAKLLTAKSSERPGGVVIDV